MAASWFSCKPCSESDPTQHTVKVDPKLFDKENVQPVQSSKQTAEEQRQHEIEEEKAARRRKEEAAAAAAAEEARRREEAERVAAAEKARQEAEEAARQVAEKTRQEALRLAAEEETRRQEEEKEKERAAAAAAAFAAEQEAAQKAEEERAALARKEADAKVAAWCKTHGFVAMNTQKKTYRGNTKFPLHTAVKHRQQEIIGMLLLIGAQKDVKDSKGQTPLQLAAKLNKNGSHDQIVDMLR